MLKVDAKCAALMHLREVVDNPICRWTGGWGNVVDVELEMGPIRRWSMYAFGMVKGCAMAQLVVDAYRKGKLSRQDFMIGGGPSTFAGFAADKYLGTKASQRIQQENDDLFSVGFKITNLHPAIDHLLAIRHNEMREEMAAKLEALDAATRPAVHPDQDLHDSVRSASANVVACDRAEEDAADLVPA